MPAGLDLRGVARLLRSARMNGKRPAGGVRADEPLAKPAERDGIATFDGRSLAPRRLSRPGAELARE
jgi:hypothetical protein